MGPMNVWVVFNIEDGPDCVFEKESDAREYAKDTNQEVESFEVS